MNLPAADGEVRLIHFHCRTVLGLRKTGRGKTTPSGTTVGLRRRPAHLSGFPTLALSIPLPSTAERFSASKNRDDKTTKKGSPPGYEIAKRLFSAYRKYPEGIQAIQPRVATKEHVAKR